MIIVTTGSHSTGKSTLLNLFRSDPRFVCIDSVTRDTISTEERRADNTVTDETQLRMLSAILDKMNEIVKMSEANPDKIYLLDRSWFDFVAYTRAFVQLGRVSQGTLNVIEQYTSKMIKHYDLVCYLPISFGIFDDGMRSTDENLRTLVDNEIQKQILWEPVRSIKVEGSAEERVQLINKHIDKCWNMERTDCNL